MPSDYIGKVSTTSRYIFVLNYLPDNICKICIPAPTPPFPVESYILPHSTRCHWCLVTYREPLDVLDVQQSEQKTFGVM